MVCILAKVTGRNVVVLAPDHPAKAAEIAFNLIGAAFRGGFSAAFLIQCMLAIGANEIRIQS
jgi:hypothetical protein